MIDRRILLVGEDNPYSRDPRYALYPDPPGSAGGRLCFKIMGLTKKEYIRRFERVNLCAGKWDTYEAEGRAGEIARQLKWEHVVLLGSRVNTAFGLFHRPPFTFYGRYVTLPHPSGRNRAWNEPGAIQKARDFLIAMKVLPAVPEVHEPTVAHLLACEECRLDLPMTFDGGGARPACCQNCHALVTGPHCPECGPRTA